MTGNTIYYSLTDWNRAQPVKNFIGTDNYREMNLLWQFAQNQHCPYDGLCNLEFACLQLNFTNPLWHST